MTSLFVLQQRVSIKSTAELDSKYDGQEGWIHKHWATKPEWWTVLTKDGNTNVFHETQLSPVGIMVDDLKLTQDGFRHPFEEVEKMIEFVKAGGRFNLESLNRYAPDKTHLLVAITQFEDGSLYVRDGFHRVMAIFAGRPDGMLFHDEYFLEHLTYQRMMTPNLPMAYYTPFDPRLEVRASDFGNFRLQAAEIVAQKGDVLAFIESNRNVYVRRRLPHHYSVADFAKHIGLQEASRGHVS